jgi:hypothetical protein
MKSTDWKCGVLAAPLFLGGALTAACGGGSSSAPSAANAMPPAAPETATPVATAGKSPSTMPQTLNDPSQVKVQTQPAADAAPMAGGNR